MKIPKKRLWMGPTKRAPKTPTVVTPFSTRLPAVHRANASECKQLHFIPPIAPLSDGWLRTIPGYVKADVGALNAPHVLARNQPIEPGVVQDAKAVYRPSRLMRRMALRDRGLAELKETERLRETEDEDDPEGIIAREYTYAIAEDVRREALARGMRKQLRERLEYLESWTYQSRYAAAAEAMPVHHSMWAEETYLQDHRVTIVRGGTGTGKSTQIPQILLDQRLHAGVPGQVVVTQPRRIAATSLAKRVAGERGEAEGATVGHAVAHDAVEPDNPASILYCTTMMLVRRIIFYRRRLLRHAKLGTPFREDPTYPQWTLENLHVVVDEVHERSAENDFLLLLLRQALLEVPSLRVTLMSATVAPDEFVDYFAPDFKVEVKDYEGRLFPVKQLHLDAPVLAPLRERHFKSTDPTELVLSAAQPAAIADFIDWCARSREELGLDADDDGAVLVFLPGWKEILGVEAALKKLWGGRAPTGDHSKATPAAAAQHFAALMASKGTSRAHPGRGGADETSDAASSSTGGLSASGGSSSSSSDGDEGGHARQAASTMHPARAAAAAAKGQTPHDTGREATDVAATPALDAVPASASAEARSGAYKIIRLHSHAPRAHMDAVWELLPGVQKVILATNIAETSITVTDVSIVVNTGLVNEMVADGSGMDVMRMVRCAKSNNTQRAGRVGRVRKGAVVHMYPSTEALASMPTPAMQRLELSSLVLLAYELDLFGCDSAAAAFQQCIAPPSDDKIDRAVKALLHLGAIAVKDQSVVITNLGRDLNTLGTAPQEGRTLLYGLALGCVEPVATIMALFAQSRSTALLRDLDQAAYDYVGCDASDIVDAAMRLEARFAAVAPEELTVEQRTVLRRREMLLRALQRAGRFGRTSLWADEDVGLLKVHPAFNRHGAMEVVVRAVLAAVQHPARIAANKRQLFLRNNCSVAPGGSLVRRKNFALPPACAPHGIAVYSTLMRVHGKLQAVDPTYVSPLMLVTMAPRVVAVRYDDNPDIIGLVADDWITVVLPALHAKYLMSLHKYMQKTLHQHLIHHTTFDYNATVNFVNHYVRLLWAEDPERERRALRATLPGTNFVLNVKGEEELLHEDTGDENIFEDAFFT